MKAIVIIDTRPELQGETIGTVISTYNVSVTHGTMPLSIDVPGVIDVVDNGYDVYSNPR